MSTRVIGIIFKEFYRSYISLWSFELTQATEEDILVLQSTSVGESCFIIRAHCYGSTKSKRQTSKSDSFGHRTCATQREVKLRVIRTEDDMISPAERSPE
jgi:hypothetical protein